MTARPCITPRCVGVASGRSPRCSPCEQANQQARNATRVHYHGDWTARSLTARQQHVEQHGLRCMGPSHPPHPVNSISDLELDHTTGQVMCHQANVDMGRALR